MREQKSIKFNFLMNVILTMSSFIFPLITFPYVSRVLLPVGTGKVSFATSLVSYFGMFASLGIPSYGMRICAQVRDDREKLTRTAHELLFINLVMSAISYCALFFAIFNIPRLQEEKILYIITSFSIALTAIGMEWLYKALEQYSYITIRSLILKIFSLVALFLLVHEKGDYVKYGAISIVASSASMIFNFVNVHKYIDMKPVGNYNIKRHMKPTLIFFAMSCATTIYTNLDTVMLGFMTTDADVGYYNAAIRIKSILVSVVTSLGAVLLPRSAYYVEHGLFDEFSRVSKKAVNFVVLISVPLMVYFMIFAKNGIYFLSGREYTDAILPMQIIMPTLVFIGLSNIFGLQILVPTGRENIVLYSEIAGALTDLMLNFILIPKYASVGAAIGTVVAEFVVLVVQYIALKKEEKIFMRHIGYIKILIGVLIASIMSVKVSAYVSSDLIILLVSASVFFGVYGIFLLIVKETFVVEIVEQILRSIRKNENK